MTSASVASRQRNSILRHRRAILNITPHRVRIALAAARVVSPGAAHAALVSIPANARAMCAASAGMA